MFHRALIQYPAKKGDVVFLVFKKYSFNFSGKHRTMKLTNNHKRKITCKDSAFFEKLYQEYYSLLVRFAEGILFDEEEAHDVTQEVFLDLWNKPKNLRFESELKTYLFACVKYKSFNRIKKLNIIDRHNEQLKESYLFSYQYSSIHDKELQDKFREIKMTFPPKMQKIVELHNFGWTYLEIAEKLQISINSVKTQLKRAYKRFREELKKNYLLATSLWMWAEKFFFDFF